MHIPKPHIHDVFVKYFSNKELDELYLSVFLKTFAESMISLFIPIYLLTLGYGLADIATYYLIHYITVFVVMIPGMWSNMKFGIKKTMVFGIIALIGFYYLIHQLDNGLSYVFLALLLGLSTGLYFAAFHVEFTKSALKHEEGRDISIIGVFAIIAGILGPLIGSLFIENVSFNFLFIIVASILVLSVLPLFFTKDIKLKKEKFSLKKFATISSKKHALVYEAQGLLHAVGGVFWPVFIYLTLKSVVSLGVIVSITSLLLVIFIVYLGNLADRNASKMLKVGVWLNAPFWIIRLLFLTPLGLFLTNLGSASTSAVVGISFNKMVYAKAHKTKFLAHFFVFRELHLAVGRVLLLVVLIFTSSLLWMFILAFFVEFVHLAAIKR